VGRNRATVGVDGAGHVHRRHLPTTAVANDHPINQTLHYIVRPMVTHTVRQWREP
jgi:hypothetical protein